LIDEKATPKTYLDNFIAKNPRFSKGTIIKTVGGGVSVCLPLEETVADNLIIVGDAARMIDPLTGGGIYNGCYSAIQAGKTICEALEKETYDKEALSSYEERWRERLEMEMARNFLAKEKLIEISDETLNSVVSAISEYDLKEMSTEELLKALKDKHPELVDKIGSFL
jgi:digeranylgeranylglycerophospholipid reductase